MATKKIALFIDADNISARFGKQIISTLESRGEIFIRRIYGNWEKTSLHGWNDCIRNFALHTVQQTDFVSGKNATDMCLTIDAMDVLHGGKAEIFALVSNDSDFTPLVVRLREGGMNIIGMGNGNASNAFRAACNEFINLDAAEVKPAQRPPAVEKISPAPVKPEKKAVVQLSLFDDTSELQPPVTNNPKVISLDERKLQSERDKKIQQMHDALHESAQLHADAEGFTSINYARQDLRKKNFAFTVHDFGYGQLKDFIAAYPKLYDLQQDAAGRHIRYRCRKIEPQTHVEDDKLKIFHATLSAAIVTCAAADGFANLCAVGTCVAQQNLGFGVKDLGYSSLQKFLAAFPNLYDVRQDENNFSARCLPIETKPPVDELEQLHGVLHEAAGFFAEADGFVNLWWVCDFIIGKKNLVREIKELTCKDLVDFVRDFPDRYELRQQSDNAFAYRCRTVALKPDNRLQKLHSVLYETAKAFGDESGFAKLSQAGDAITKKNLSLKGSGHGTLQKFLAAFPTLYEVQKTGQTLRYRCRRLQK